MSMRWFKTFLMVSRTGSFASAAQKIDLTQAAVSIQMSGLEEKLRIKLFDRSARTATLNTAGRELALRVPALVDLYDNIGNGLDNRPLGGTLALGAIHHTFAKLLPDALLLMRQLHPDIVVQVCNGVSDELMRKVELGELDAAIVSEPPFKLPQSVSWQPLAAEPLVLVAPADVRVKSLSAALATYPFIGISRSSWTGQLTHSAFRRHRLKINEVMELNSLEAIAAMVVRGFGISILPASGYLWALEKQVQLSLLTEPQISRQIGLVHRVDQGHPALVSALSEILTQTVSRKKSGHLRALRMDS